MYRRCRSIVFCAALVSWLVGCDDSKGVVDPGLPDSGLLPFVPSTPAPPAPPLLTPCPESWTQVPPEVEGDPATCEPWPDGDPSIPPALIPCPEGWREVDDLELQVLTCDPWPATGPAECALGEAHFPGEPAGCRLVGTPCPVGAWADDLPVDEPVIYVSAGAGDGGTGTRAEPFGTITEAAAVAVGGDIIALSKGTFDEVVVLDHDVILWGACIAETLVTCSEPLATGDEAAGTISLSDAATVVIRNLRVSGARAGIWARCAGCDLTLEDLFVVDSQYAAVAVTDGSTLDAENLVLRDTGGNSDGAFGFGLLVRGGSQAEVRHLIIEGSREGAVLVLDAATQVTLTDAVLRDSLGRVNDTAAGWGVFAMGEARVDLVRAELARNRDAGVVLGGEGTFMQLTDVVIRDTQPQLLDGRGGRAVNVEVGAALSGERLWLVRNIDAGIVVAGRSEGGVSATATVTDLVLTHTAPVEVDRYYGHGIHVDYGGEADILRAVVAHNTGYGVLARGDAVVTVTDVVARDTASRRLDEEGGSGFCAELGAQLDVVRALAQGNHDVGIFIQNEGTLASLTDVVVRDTQGRALDGLHGRGLEVQDGARAVVEGALFEGNAEIGVAAIGAELSLADVVVRGTLSELGRRGHGIGAQARAQVTVQRALVEGNNEVGIVCSDSGTTLGLTDVIVRDTQSRDDGTFGRGLYVQAGGRLEASRLLAADNVEAAIHVADETSTALFEDLLVRDTRCRASDGLLGRGLFVQDAGPVSVARGLFARNHEVSVFASYPGATVELTDVVVRDTLVVDCFDEEHCPGGAGIGVGAYGGANVTLERFLVIANALCGLQLAHARDSGGLLPDGGTMDLSDGAVTDNPVGANIQTPGFDFDRILHHVAWDNLVELSARNLPVPGV